MTSCVVVVVANTSTESIQDLDEHDSKPFAPSPAAERRQCRLVFLDLPANHQYTASFWIGHVHGLVVKPVVFRILVSFINGVLTGVSDVTPYVRPHFVGLVLIRMREVYQLSTPYRQILIS